MKKLLFTCIAIVAFVIAAAMPTYTKTFNTTYKLKSTSKLSKAACSVCHTSRTGGKLNLYGAAIQTEMKKAKTTKMTLAILKKVEALDSDKDGCINLCEIIADRMPGVKDPVKK